MTTNDIAKIQLFRIAATMPWAEVETTQQNVRLTYYDGAQEDAKQTVIVLTRDEAKAIAKALNVLAENYFAKPDTED